MEGKKKSKQINSILYARSKYQGEEDQPWKTYIPFVNQQHREYTSNSKSTISLK